MAQAALLREHFLQRRARRAEVEVPLSHWACPSHFCTMFSAMPRLTACTPKPCRRPLVRLDPHERARSLALHPDGARFVLGAEWSLRAFGARGDQLWRQPAPGAAWAVNVAGDGRLAVAAYGDGTLRWHRMDDGREVLALMPLADRANWVAWTPEGFYAASPGAHGVLRWHVNRPGWEPADDHAVPDIPGFYRPEAIPLVLRELETPRAVGLATIAEQRRRMQLLTGSGVPPGARLHLLAVGVSRYDGRHAGHLRLDFAQQWTCYPPGS